MARGAAPVLLPEAVADVQIAYVDTLGSVVDAVDDVTPAAGPARGPEAAGPEAELVLGHASA